MENTARHRYHGDTKRIYRCLCYWIAKGYVEPWIADKGIIKFSVTEKCRRERPDFFLKEEMA